MTQAVGLISLGIPYCALTYGVPPCTAGDLAVPAADGALVGNMTGAGGLAGAFDGVTGQSSSSTANIANSAVDGFVGKDWGDGQAKIMREAAIYGPSNIALARNAANVNTSTAIHLKGSQDGVTWTTLASGVTGTSLSAVVTLTATGAALLTAYRFHAVFVQAIDASSDMQIAEVKFTEMVTGLKCFNTKATCQAPLAYDEETIFLTFALGADYVTAELDAIPCIVSIDYTPGKVGIDGTLGERSVLRVVMKDGQHSDTGPGFDKYWAERDYDPYRTGTLFGKFRARQKYLRGKTLIWTQTNAVFGNLEQRTYVVDSVDGPNEDGLFTIIAKDPLKLLDGDRAQAPFLSGGHLSGNITDVATSATLLPVGIGATYAASGHVAIGGNEVCSFTRSGDVLTLVRGVLGTVASAHNAEDRVQTVLRFAGVSPATIIQTLETIYGDVPSSYINLTEWQDEIDAFSGQVYTLNVTEPTSVRQLVQEVLESAGLYTYWDDLAKKLRLKVIRAIPADAAVFSPAERREGSLEVVDQPEKRLSRVQIYYGQIDPTKGVGDPENFRASVEVVDTEAEDNYGNVVIKTIFSRCIPQFGGAIAQQLGAILLSRFIDAPRRISFEVLRTEDALIPVLGDGYHASGPFLQDAFGRAALAPVQVTRLLPGPVTKVETEEMLFSQQVTFDPTVHTVIVAANTNNFNLRTAHDRTYPDAISGDTVICIVNAGVIVGSRSTGLPSFNVGSWPSGVTVELVISGRIQGKGGDGGRGALREDGEGADDLETIPAQPGQPGGTALKTTQAILMSGTGELWGGAGGGGGGAAGIAPVTVPGSGGGGGGGQGRNIALGAVARAEGQPGHNSTNDAPGEGGNGANFGRRGGRGGNEGQPGQPGGTNGTSGDDWAVGGLGGAAGNAIDGDSFVTETGTLDVKGPRIN